MHIARLIGAALAAVITLSAQAVKDSVLPAGAFVVERAAIPVGIHKERELVLWMLSPEKHDRGTFSESNPYMCPERTMGSYYSGPTRISLVDTNSRRVINTIKIGHEWIGEDTFDIPYRILGGIYYQVPGQDGNSEGKPALLALRDLNGDGLPLEAAYFEAQACMGLLTTMIGYSHRQDRVIQYEVELKISSMKVARNGKLVSDGEASMETARWVDYLFAQKPTRAGHWSFEIDYRGRGGTLDSYSVLYDPARKKFFGTLTRLAAQDIPK